MVDVIVGATYLCKINKERIKIVSIQKDIFTGNESVIYESLKDGKVFEYGFDAFKRCLLEQVEVV
jgi:hypothetical protein